MGLLNAHLQNQRRHGCPDQVLDDSGLAFADIDPLSSDSELGDLMDAHTHSCEHQQCQAGT